MNAFGWVVVVAATLEGCASVGGGGAGSLLAERGRVLVEGDSVRAVAIGPRIIHAFASSANGVLFIAPAFEDSDRDCAVATRGGTRRAVVALAADRKMVVIVGTGEVACLATSAQHDFELLWHATGEAVSQTPNSQVAMVRRDH